MTLPNALQANGGINVHAIYSTDGTLTQVINGAQAYLFGTQEYADNSGVYIGETDFSAGIQTTNATPTKLLGWTLASNYGGRMKVVITARKPATNDLAVWERTAVVMMNGANTGTPTILQASATVDTDYVASALSGIAITPFGTASGGQVNFTVTGIASVTLNWTIRMVSYPTT